MAGRVLGRVAHPCRVATMTAYPPAPVNVVAHMADGQRIPLECRYLGQDPAGIWLWGVIQRQAIDAHGLAHITMDRLPRDTVIIIDVEEAD